MILEVDPAIDCLLLAAVISFNVAVVFVWIEQRGNAEGAPLCFKGSQVSPCPEPPARP
jgi:hypothetical protein